MNIDCREKFPLSVVIFGFWLVTSLNGCSVSQQEQAMADAQRKDNAMLIGKSAKIRTSPRQTRLQRLDQLRQQSRSDLATRLHLDEAAITVVEARPVVWPNSSAGCPKPGYMYTQMLTEGVLIRLQARGRIYHYHTGAKGPAVFCKNPAPPR